MNKTLLTAMLILIPQLAAAGTQCDLIQVQCLPSVGELQLKVHSKECTDVLWYTSDELAIYEQDNIYRPYEHNKAYEGEGRSYEGHPEQPRNFICNMGENTIELELGVTDMDMYKSSYDCLNSHMYLAYMKFGYNGKAVSDKLYFDNYGFCLPGNVKGVKHIYRVLVRPEDKNTMELFFQDGFMHHIFGNVWLKGSANKPITNETIQLSDYVD